MHVPHSTILADNALTAEQLSNYELLILPDVQIIGDQDFGALREFVRSGATVMTTGQSGMFNQDIDIREEKLDGHVIFVEGQPELNFLEQRFTGPDWGLFYRNSGQELKKKIEQVIRQRDIVTDAHVSVKFNLARTPEAFLLHMVNYECGMRLIRQKVFPKTNINVRVRVPSTIGKVTLVSPDIDGYELALEYRQEGGFVDLVVPELIHYNMVMLEKHS